MKHDDVLADVFAESAPDLAQRCGAWMATSPRFAAFIEANRTKVRKKVRLAADADREGDLLRELEVAYLLLDHRGAAVTYEAFAAEKVRGPDFTITLKGHIRCHVEVKRLRIGPRPLDARLTDAICEKLHQMPPSAPNLLWVVVEAASLEAQATLSVADTMKRLLLRAEQKDGTLFSRHGYVDARAFFAQYLRLSGVLASRADDGQRDLWLNSQARHPLQPSLVSWLAPLNAPAPPSSASKSPARSAAQSRPGSPM
jgi:hypothetical protein